MKNVERSKDKNVMFTVFNPEMYSEILVVKDPKPFMNTHVVVPMHHYDGDDSSLYIAMKLVEEKE